MPSMPMDAPEMTTVSAVAPPTLCSAAVPRARATLFRLAVEPGGGRISLYLAVEPGGGRISPGDAS